MFVTHDRVRLGPAMKHLETPHQAATSRTHLIWGVMLYVQVLTVQCRPSLVGDEAVPSAESAVA